MACAVTGFVAKENVVGTVATLFGLSAVISGDLELVGEGSQVAEAMNLTPVAGLAYMMFNLFTPPCFAAIGAMRAEMKSTTWLLGGIALQLSVGFTVGFLVYQIGTLATTGSLAAGFLPGLIAILTIAVILAGIIIRNGRKFAAKKA